MTIYYTIFDVYHEQLDALPGNSSNFHPNSGDIVKCLDIRPIPKTQTMTAALLWVSENSVSLRLSWFSLQRRLAAKYNGEESVRPFAVLL